MGFCYCCCFCCNTSSGHSKTGGAPPYTSIGSRFVTVTSNRRLRSEWKVDRGGLVLGLIAGNVPKQIALVGGNQTRPRFWKIRSLIDRRATTSIRPNRQYCSATSRAGSGKPRLAAPAVPSRR